MRTAYFDCFSGAAGDMIVAALLDAGASLERLTAALDTLPLPGFQVTSRKITKQGLAATAFEVHCDHKQPHRHLRDVEAIIHAGAFSARVQDQAGAIFRRLAEAEAAVHGTTIEKVHFHEVGAVDAIVDILGACLALEDLGVDEVRCSAMVTGSGTVHCAHGELPVPAPATAELLKHVPLAPCDEVGELTTPTGAAVLTTLGRSFAPLGNLSIERIGYGAGTRQGRHRPNVLRVLVGASGGASVGDAVAVLQANIDDQSPELVAHAQQRLLQEGALDAYCQPIYMKKGRPGLLLTVLCDPGRTDDFSSLMLAETTTLGVRQQIMQRRKLQRRHDEVTLPHGTVRIKVGLQDGRVLTAAPEFEDCRRVAENSGLPLKEVMSMALSRHREQLPPSDRSQGT